MGLYGLRSELAYLKRLPSADNPWDGIRAMRKVALLNVAWMRHHGIG